MDQPHNRIGWNLTCNYTAYPNETDYSLIEVKILTRENKGEGITFTGMSGRIRCPSRAAADTRLDDLVTALKPSGYVTLSQEVNEGQVTSETVVDAEDQSDGTSFTELNFNYEFRDVTSLTCRYTPSGGSYFDLGTVDEVADRYSVTLFDEMRDQRKRAAGVISINGTWFLADGTTNREAALTAKKQAFDAKLLNGSSGLLVYGSIINATVRILDFQSRINRLKNYISWSLTAHYTRFPNEADYCICEFRVGTRENKGEGTVIKTLSGRIGAPSNAIAVAKLARLRTEFIPSGYVLISESPDDVRIDSESGGGGSTVGTGDGPGYIELGFNDEWQKTSGQTITWTLRRSDDDDVKSGFIRTTYSGTVQAYATTQAAAFSAALATAQSLGDDKPDMMKVRSTVTENDRLTLTSGGNIFGTVEFNYEYQHKGTKIYTEVTAELANDVYGNDSINVSGYIAAPTYNDAYQIYLTEVRGNPDFEDLLLINERKLEAEQRLNDGSTRLATQLDRFNFSFSVYSPKSAATNSAAYEIEISSNPQTHEKRTTVSGTVWSQDETSANGFLDSLITALGLTGTRLPYSRKTRQMDGPRISGYATGGVFTALEFTEAYLADLGGEDGILESEVVMDLQHSGNRLVEHKLPDDASIVQFVGTTIAQRTVQARCLGTTKAACDNWIRTIRTELIEGTYEHAPRVTTRYVALPNVSLILSGGSENVHVFEVTGYFSELAPEIAFT